MVEIDVSYEGHLHCQAVHGPSGTKLVTDAPTDNMGKGESFSPSDLVATALGTCILTVLGIVARRQGLKLAGTKAKVTKEMVSSPSRRIGRLSVDIHVPTPLSEPQRKLLENAANSCPVKHSLHPDVEVAVAFHWS